MQEIELAMLNHRAQIGIDLPKLACLLEVFDQ